METDSFIDDLKEMITEFRRQYLEHADKKDDGFETITKKLNRAEQLYKILTGKEF